MKLSHLYESVIARIKTLLEYEFNQEDRFNNIDHIEAEKNAETVFKNLLTRKGYKINKSDRDTDTQRKIDFKFTSDPCNHKYAGKTVQFIRRMTATKNVIHDDFHIEICLEEIGEINLNTTGIKQLMELSRLNKRRPKYFSEADYMMMITTQDDEILVAKFEDLKKIIDDGINAISQIEQQENNPYFKNRNSFTDNRNNGLQILRQGNKLVAYINPRLADQIVYNFDFDEHRELKREVPSVKDLMPIVDTQFADIYARGYAEGNPRFRDRALHGIRSIATTEIDSLEKGNINDYIIKLTKVYNNMHKINASFPRRSVPVEYFENIENYIIQLLDRSSNKKEMLKKIAEIADQSPIGILSEKLKQKKQEMQDEEQGTKEEQNKEIDTYIESIFEKLNTNLNQSIEFTLPETYAKTPPMRNLIGEKFIEKANEKDIQITIEETDLISSKSYKKIGTTFKIKLTKKNSWMEKLDVETMRRDFMNRETDGYKPRNEEQLERDIRDIFYSSDQVFETTIHEKYDTLFSERQKELFKF